MKPLVLAGHTRPLTQVRFNNDGDLLFTSGKDSQLIVWSGVTGEILGSYDGHQGAVQSFDVTANSELLLTASADCRFRVFDVATGDLILEFDMGAVVRSVEWCGKQDSPIIRFVTANDRFASKNSPVQHAVTIWEFDVENRTVNRVLSIEDQQLPMKAQQVHWGPFDETIVTVHEEGTIFVWDSTTGEELKHVDAHKRAINKFQLSGDKKLAITASSDMTAKIWDTINWECVRTLVSDRPLNDATISPIYRDCLTSEDGIIREHVIVGGGQEARDVTTTRAQEGKFETILFQLIEEEELGKIRGHFGPLNTLAWMPNGKGFATGGEDGFVRLHVMDQEYFSKKWE